MDRQHATKCPSNPDNKRWLTKEPCTCDGYHTFNELYDHRVTLYIALCKLIHNLSTLTNLPEHTVWKSKKHSDDSTIEDWFVLGMDKEQGKQITYHLPMERWHDCNFANELPKAPEFDGHTSDDVLERLSKLGGGDEQK